MFHTSTFPSAGFQDWLKATHQLHLTNYLELGGHRQDHSFAQANDIKAQPQDQFLLFCDDEAGICGSAAIVALPHDLEIEGQFIPQGTWMLRNVFFHIKAGHPIQEQPEKFTRIVAQFHLGLFEHLWHVAQRSGHQLALSLQQDWEAHEDLEYFGGFTFQSEMMEEDQGLQVAMAIVPLTQKTYQTFTHKKKKHFKKINLGASYLSSRKTTSLSEATL